MEGKGLSNLIFWNDFKILASYLLIWLQKVRNVIKMALKSLFFAAKSQKLPSGWWLRSQAPVYSHWIFKDYAPSTIHLSCIYSFSTVDKSGKFGAKKKKLLVYAFLAKLWLYVW